MVYAAYPLHVGAFGVAVRVLYGLLGIAPAVLSVTGVLIWYRRWRRQDRAVRAPQIPARPAKAVLPTPARSA